MADYGMEQLVKLLALKVDQQSKDIAELRKELTRANEERRQQIADLRKAAEEGTDKLQLQVVKQVQGVHEQMYKDRTFLGGKLGELSEAIEGHAKIFSGQVGQVREQVAEVGNIVFEVRNRLGKEALSAAAGAGAVEPGQKGPSTAIYVPEGVRRTADRSRSRIRQALDGLDGPFQR